MTMRRSIVLAFVLCCGSAAAQDAAQPPAMTPEQQKEMEAWAAAGKPGAQHEQLRAMEGDWDAAVSMWMDPSAPPEQSKARSKTESIHGGRFQRTTFNGEWMGEPFEGTAVTGYDNARKKYVSTWYDSMSTGIYFSTGDYDAATKTYTFHGEVADPVHPGTMTKVRETIRIDGPDRHTMTWHESRGGKPEAKTMEIVYTRRK
jgi:hypothetical protein